jgi:hypothetical protein
VTFPFASGPYPGAPAQAFGANPQQQYAPVFFMPMPMGSQPSYGFPMPRSQPMKLSPVQATPSTQKAA